MSNNNKLIIGATVLVVCAGAYGYHTANKNLNGIDKKYFLNNVIGIPLTAKVKDDAIKVAVSNSFTEEQKQHIKEAIEELDIDVNGVEYEIILNETIESPVSDFNCIHIKKIGEFEHEVREQYNARYDAKTTIYHNPFTGKIIYPLTISLNVESMNNTAESRADTTEFYDKDGYPGRDNGKSHEEYFNEAVEQVFKRVVKHEMLHTLGLVDQYADEMETETIMYYANTYDAPLDLTDLDKHIVNTVYTTAIANQDIKISSTVHLPDKVKVPESVIEKARKKYGDSPEL